MNIEGKVWGTTSELLKKNNVKVNRAVINGGYQCSKHQHYYTHNMFFVESGFVEIHRWKNDYDLVDITMLRPGDSCTVPPGEYHRFVGIDQESVLYEMYWIELSDDIERKDCGGPI